MVEMSGEGMEDAGGGMEEVMETSSSNGEGKKGGDVLLFKMLSKEGHVMFEKSCARVREGSDGRRGEEATTLVEEGYEVVERKDENGEGNGEDKRGSAGNDNEGGEGENGKERTAETKDAEDANADEEGGTASTSNTNCTSGAVGGSSSGGLTSQGKSVTGEDGEPFTVLAECLGLGAEYDRDVRKAARVDYYATVLRFARETCEFSQEQSSVVLSLCNSVLEAVVAGKPKEDLIAIVKDVMLPRLGQDPSLVTFTTDDTKKVTDFVVAGIMRHRSLYKLVFDVEAHRSECFHEVVVEQPLLPPLRPALTEAAWERKNRQEKREREEAEAAVLRAAAQDAMEKAAEAARAAEEAEAEARRAALAKKPATLEEAVQKLVLEKVEEAQARMAKDHAAREEELLARIAVLERGESAAEELPEPAPEAA